MENLMNAVKITDSVYWVGAIDRSLKEFHGYRTPRGTTYNAYLIMADKITLIDTVKEEFFEEMMARISTVIDPSKINYVVSLHSEPDHSGSLVKLQERIKPEKTFASLTGVTTLNEEFPKITVVTAVKELEKLSLGNMSLTFAETRMLHWPDSMVAYLDKDKILFSQDAFGMHLGCYERFDDELPWDTLVWEAKSYFANIIMPYSDLVIKTIEKLSGLNLDLKLIAPDHGPIWREKIPQIMDHYLKWANQKVCRKALVVYDTMWHSTEKMAKILCEGLSDAGTQPMVFPLSSSHRTYIATEVLEAGALLVGSPTLNRNVLPSVADILTYLKGLRPKNLIGSAFGSYGWSGESTKIINDYLHDMGVKIESEPIHCRYTPKHEDYQKLYDLGRSIAQKLDMLCK